MARKLIVEVLGDSSSYERSLNRSSAATKKFGTEIGKTSAASQGLRGALSTTGGAGGFLFGSQTFIASALLTGALLKSIGAASDLNEEISKSRQIFAGSATEIKQWSTTTAESLGISQVEALRATGTYGALFKTLGFGEKQNADLSKTLVQLASDMASFNNADPSEVLLALRSGLVGEAEPLRRFGVFLSEARVQQLALAQTGKSSIKVLTNQEKAFARYSIIMKDTASAQGDFARTSGGLANQQRILKAQVSNLEASLGTALIPTVTGVVGALNDAIAAGNDLKDVLKALAGLPGIEIPIKLVSEVTGGRGGFILRHIILGSISPLALGITIGKEIHDGIVAGVESGPGIDLSKLMPGQLPTLPPLPGFPVLPPVKPPKGKPAPFELLDEQAEQQRAKNIIDGLTRQAQAGDKKLLAQSEARAAHLRDLIRQDPDNVKLQARLTTELNKQATLQGSIASAAKSAASAAVATAKATAQAARDAIIGALDLRDAQAGLTKSLQDDLSAAEARESTLKRLVGLNRDDLDLAQQLVAATQARRDLEKQIADNRKAAVKSQQFKALGLTPEGEKPTPGAGSLLKRATGLQQQIKGTVLDTSKTRSQLRRIVNFLRTHLKTAGKDVRAAVLGMLNDISGAFDKDAKTGPLTKTHGLATAQIIKNLGLSAEQADEIQRRLAHATTGGGGRTIQRATGGGQRPRTASSTGKDDRIVVESHTTINIDGKKVANVVTRNQQKDKRRNPKQKRGPHRK